MKNYNLLFALLLLASPLLAQQKTEFGLLVKAGNFTLPQKGPGPEPLGFTHSENALSGGYSIGLGIYGERNIALHWDWSTELRYTLSSFSLHEKFDFDANDDAYILIERDWTRRYTEQTLVLPLKLQYHFGAAGKTALGFGLAPSFNLRTRQAVSSAVDVWTFYHPYFTQYQQPAKPAPRMQLLLVGSLHEQIGSRASVGIEWMAALRHNDLGIYFKDYESKTFAARSPFSMKSLSMSLKYCLWR